MRFFYDVLLTWYLFYALNDGLCFQGFYIAALSTTILFLAQNVNGSSKDVSFIFTGAAVGNLVGSNLAVLVVKKKHALMIIGSYFFIQHDFV